MKVIKNYDELIKYNHSIYEYEKETSEFEKSDSPIKSKGYIIYNEDFHILKKLLNYNGYKMHVIHGKNNNKKFNFKEDDIEQIKKLEVIKIKSVEYIKNKIKHNNKDFILITEKLKDLISNKYEKSIEFTAEKGKVILFINQNKPLELQHKNLILSLQINETEDDEIQNIYDSIWKFFIFENKITEQLKENNPKSDFGLLVKKIWLDKWKNYTNYDYFKKNYLAKYKYSQKVLLNIQKSLINEIIDYREIKNYRYPIPTENDIFIGNIDKIKNILKNNQLAIIDLSFKNFFQYFNSQGIEIKYQLCHGEITIKLGNVPDLILKTTDNILSFENIIQKEEENNLDKDLIQLIKIYCFQRSFPDIEDKTYINNNIQRDKVILINKNKIQNYKDNFNYCELIIHLDKIINSIKQIKKNGKIIDYYSLNDNIIEQIITELKNKIKYNFSINNENKLLFNKNHTFRINRTKDYNYIDNFELINEDIANFFLHKGIINSKDIIEGEIIIDNINIVLIFSYQSKNYYEIGYFNSNKDYIIESIIKENYNRDNKFKNDITDDLCEGIQKFLNYEDGDKILLNGNIYVGNFYIINNCDDNIDSKNKKNNENKIDKVEEEFVNDIISFVILIYSFNLEIKENLNKRFHYNPNKRPINGYLFNKNEFNKFKQIIHSEEIQKLIQNLKKSSRISENEKNSILGKIKLEKDGYFTKIILKKMIIKI